MGKRVQRPAGPEQTGMLTEGNDHIGRAIWAFSIPAVMTCPGMTLACTIACYAMKFLFMHAKQNLDRHERHLPAGPAQPDQFARDMILEIRFKRVKILRIHVAGDFFSDRLHPGLDSGSPGLASVTVFVLYSDLARARVGAPPAGAGRLAQCVRLVE